MRIQIKNKNAISLVVLVITIIVLAILAGSVIMTLSNTNIISQASDAAKETEAQQIEEAKTLMYIDGKLGKNPSTKKIGDYTLSWDDTTKSVQATVDTVKIPDGFYYVGGTKDTGLVISDDILDTGKGVDYTCVGNQFVWVPVEYTATGTTDTNGLDTGFTAVFKRGTPEETSSGSGIYKMTGALDSSYKEPYVNGYATEAAEYYAMCKSVQKYNGFYIARFEAGDGDVTSARTAVTEAHTVVSKKGAFVYNYVPWGNDLDDIGTGGAVYLSQNMYKNHESVVSTLCYGVQWDATMNFVSDAEHNIYDSKSWGNHIASMGVAATDSGTVQTTGKNEAWKAKNIYDLAGNVSDYTMEYASPFHRSARGGHYDSDDSAFDREGCYGDGLYTGFRPALYIVVE